MTNPDPQQTPPPPPTSATVHSNASLIQWLSVGAAVTGAATTYLQLLPPSTSWVQPALMFSGLAGVAFGAALKTLNSKNLLLLILLGIGLVGMGGCSNMTPNQRYKLDAAGYDISVIGFTAADAAGKVPTAAKPPAAIAFADAKQRLTDAYAWLTANPTLANTPGISPPSLDALDIATDAVRAIVRNYLLASPLVPINPPTTQPATTQPVPNPIPG